MKKIYRPFLLAVIVTASWSLSRWWLHTQGEVINLPQSAWDWLANLYGVTNAEQGADLEGIVGLSGALIFVTILTCLAEGIARWLWWRRRCRQLPSQPTTQIGFKQIVAQWACSCGTIIYFLLLGAWSLVATFNGLQALEEANRLPLLFSLAEQRPLLSFFSVTAFVFALSWLVLRLVRKLLLRCLRSKIVAG